MSVTWNQMAKLYVLCVGYFVLLWRFDLASLAAAEDFINYFDAYNNVDRDGGLARFGSDVLLPLLYSGLRSVLGELRLEDFLPWHFLISYVAAGVAMMRVATGPGMLLVMLAVFDYYFSAHLARQFLSSAFVILALAEYFGRRRWSLILVGVGLGGLAHSTGPLFFGLGLLFGRLSSRQIRIMVIVGLVMAATGASVGYVDLLRTTQGLPVIGRAFFAMSVFLRGGESAPRFLAVIGAVIFAVLPATRWYEKVTAGFLALTMAVYPIPILNARLGMIGSSILVGVPYWMLLARIGARITTRRHAPA